MEIIVLGMHRSGTSMVTRLLNLAGAYFGPEHLHTGANEENPKGFWERTDVRALNDALLHEADAEWDRPMRLSGFTPESGFLEAWNDGACKILEECHDHTSCVLKEPRMGLTFPYWRPHFQRPVIVWIHRHPVEVALSLQRRNGFPIAYGLALWEWYTVQTGHHIRHENILLTHHEPWMTQPERELAGLLGQIQRLGGKGLEMPTSQIILDFVDPNLHHARRGNLETSRNLPHEVQALWEKVTAPEIEFSAWPESVSAASLERLQIGDATAPPILERLRSSVYQNKRLQSRNIHLAKKASHYQDKSQTTARNYERLKVKLKQSDDRKNALQKRVIELEQAWENLKSSKLWQLGLIANRLRSTLGLGKTERTENPGPAPSIPTPDSVSLELRAPVTVVVPIFNAMAQVRQCLQSLLRNTGMPHRLLLIDDASTEEGLFDYLEAFSSKQRHVTLLHHQNNAGYTATVNEGIAWAGEDDVVLLNSDTMVPSGWLRRLQDTAYFKAKVATVTPLSNAAGAFSIPKNHQVNTLPEGWDVETFAELVAATSPRIRPEVPTGNGFCLFIRREAIEEIGQFDTQAFPRGYGEENDFCMRAGKNRYVHLIDDASFVYHHRSASFGDEKKALIAHSRTVLAERWPDYKPAVTRWLDNDPLDPFRHNLTEALAAKPNPRPQPNQQQPIPILYVLHDGGGGTRLTSHHLMAALPKPFRPFLLVTGRRKWELYAQQGEALNPIETWEFEETWSLDQSLSEAKVRLLEQLCSHYAVRLAHVRHFLGNAPEATAMLRERNIGVVLSFHDFYSVCPTIQLIDRTGHFCGGHCHANDQQPPKPGFHAKTDAEDCVLAGNWFQSAPVIRNQYIKTWRKRIDLALTDIHAAVTTSEAAKAVLLQNYSALKDTRFEIIEHGRDFPETANLACPPGDDPVNLICFGALGHSKGLNTIEALAALDRDRQRFNFHLLGNVASDWVPPTSAVTIHGPYDNTRLFERLAPLAPSIVLIPSLWPETYCHTLTEAWMAGLPVLASDIGTLQERIQRHGGGWLADPHDPSAWYQTLLEVCHNPEEYRQKAHSAQAYQPVSIAAMARRYETLYRNLLDVPEAVRE